MAASQRDSVRDRRDIPSPKDFREKLEMIAARAAALLFALFFALKPALALEDSKYQNLL